MIDRFNLDPEIYIFLISTLAGGTGLNLTGANKVVIFGEGTSYSWTRRRLIACECLADPNWSVFSFPSLLFPAYKQPLKILLTTFRPWIAPIASAKCAMSMFTGE